MPATSTPAERRLVSIRPNRQPLSGGREAGDPDAAHKSSVRAQHHSRERASGPRAAPLLHVEATPTNAKSTTRRKPTAIACLLREHARFGGRRVDAAEIVLRRGEPPAAP